MRRARRNPELRRSGEPSKSYDHWSGVPRRDVARITLRSADAFTFWLRIETHDGGELVVPSADAIGAIRELDRAYRGVEVDVNGVHARVGTALWRRLADEYARGARIERPSDLRRRALQDRNAYYPTREFFLYVDNDYGEVMLLRRIQRALDAGVEDLRRRRRPTAAWLRTAAHNYFAEFVRDVVARYNYQFEEKLRLSRVDRALIERLLWRDYASGDRI